MQIFKRRKIAKLNRREADHWSYWVRLPFILLWDFIDNRAIVRRVSFIFVIYMTYLVLDWAMDFANNNPDMDGLKMGAVLGAVMTPWSIMQAAIFKFYSDDRATGTKPVTG